MESGAVGNCQDHREQSRNKAEALRRLTDTDTFKNWHKRKVSEIMLKKQGIDSLEKQVDKAMREENLKVEVQESGKWTEPSNIEP
ncbi:hypothetical protein D3C71_2046810 [compost metagenome]